MKSEWNCTVVSHQSSIVSTGIDPSSLGVDQEDNGDPTAEHHKNPAAERRQNAAHGVSRGNAMTHNQAPEGRKNLPSPRLTNGGRDAHRTAGGPVLSEVEGTPALRLGLRYARGLREEAAQALVRERSIAPFHSIHDLVHRVPELRKDELNTLAEIGALNSVSSFQFPVLSSGRGKLETGNLKLHRRDALWQIERSVRDSGPLLDELPEPDSSSPLRPMDPEERLVADFRGTGLTVGPHPMAYHRARMDAIRVHKASDLAGIPNGKYLRIGGCVIARQRPGTAKGFVFLSLEDETGVANAIIMPDLFQKNRLLVTSEQFLMVEGV
jgi:error-prone DNA polymerase